MSEPRTLADYAAMLPEAERAGLSDTVDRMIRDRLRDDRRHQILYRALRRMHEVDDMITAAVAQCARSDEQRIDRLNAMSLKADALMYDLQCEVRPDEDDEEE